MADYNISKMTLLGDNYTLQDDRQDKYESGFSAASSGQVPSKNSSGGITWTNAGGSNGVIIATNVSVATSAWTSDTTYSDYPYKANITVTGCTSSHVPDVYFSLADATSGTFAPVASSGTNVVTIYASAVPSAVITISTIKCTKSVS